ncbi:MAG: hypothetical protein JXX29_21475 [Deltaproteobacteria bacterium]|nr:hypothetical protein [Deltaproteobacteria bacterium]MBN2674266.1 hypothetical protein [Deltaproteobacteria bacterium]
MKKISLFLIIMLGLFLAVACGGDDDDTSPQVKTSVDESKSSSELTAEEASTVCEDLYGGMTDASESMAADYADDVCAMSGYSAAVMTYSMNSGDVADADLVTACEEAETECMNAEPQQTEEEDVEAMCAAASTYISSCTVTVGEIVDCVNAQLELSQSQMEAAMDAIPDCSEITAAMIESALTTEPTESTVPAVCETVYTDCEAIASLMGASAM